MAEVLRVRELRARERSIRELRLLSAGEMSVWSAGDRMARVCWLEGCSIHVLLPTRVYPLADLLDVLPLA